VQTDRASGVERPVRADPLSDGTVEAEEETRAVPAAGTRRAGRPGGEIVGPQCVPHRARQAARLDDRALDRGIR
jgi:hypothetical protein